MKTSTKLLSMFSAFCAIILLGMTANAQSITVVPSLTATQMAQALVGTNVTVTNATYTGAATASGSFSQASSTFPLSDGIILTSGSAANALGPNNSTGASTSNSTPGDADLTVLASGITTYDAAVLEFDVTSNCTNLTFDYIFASEEYPEYGCSNFNDAFGFLITGPGYAPNTNIALVPGTTTPVAINNVINAPGNTPPCVSNPSYYVDNAAGVSVQYDGYTVVMTASATIQPCQTYHIKIVVGDAGDGILDSAIFLKGGGINCAAPSLATTANITAIDCGSLGAIDLSVNSGTGPFTYAWTGPNGFTATTEDLTGLDAGTYTVDIVGSDCLSSGQAVFTVTENIDVTAPVFTNCPSDLIIEAANNSCGFSVDLLGNATATDNCGVTSMVPSHDANHVFGVGTTPVTVTATDAAGNSTVCSFNVIVNAQPLVVTLNPFQYNGMVNIKCFGQNSGRVTAGAAGGCAPYTFTWSSGFVIPGPPSSTSTCVALFAGFVSCTVTDGAGTSVTEVVTLVENPPVVVTPTWTPIQCYGGSSTVTINAQAGTSPYNGLTTTSVFEGTYEYVVSDANGCRAYDTITITQPDILDATATNDPILCYGDSTMVSVEATGGTMPYMGTGPVQQVAGVYSYDIIDANGCTENVQLAINQPNALTAMISATPILCNGGTGLVNVSVASGTEPYTGDGLFPEQAGWHTYTVYDFNLCTDTIGILLTEPSLMVSTITATPILCNGDSSTITITGAGGTGAWVGTGTFIEPAGIYGYSFNDANGCTDTNSLTISQPAQLTMSATTGGILCFGGTADVTVTATGGTAPLTGTGVFNNGPGTYTFTVTDANGCSVSETVTLTEPPAMTAFVSCPGILCNGGTADIALTAFGGTPAYTGTGVFTVSAGTDTYTVTDANGCTASVTHTVSEPAALVVTITSTGIDCNGGSANLTVSASGGTAPYTGGGTFSVTEGAYTYTMTDANGCTTTETITVTEPDVLVASATAPSILCNGDAVDVTVTATGGTAPYVGTGTFNLTAGTYNYTITDANGCTATTSITLTEPTAMTAFASCPSILCNGGTTDLAVTAFGGTPPYTGGGVFNVGAGTYTYTLTDANGCTASVTHTVTEPAALVVTITSTGIDCNGGTSDVTVTASGGTAPYTGEGTFNVTTGTYSYTVTDANGCTTTETITVTEPAALVATATAPSILCNGGSTDVTVSATGGTAPYTGDGIYNETAGTYTYTITDANGCTATTSITLTEPSLMTAYASCPVIDCNGGTADMAVFAFGGTPPYTNTGVFNVGAGTYTYTVIDANGCTATVTHTVTEPAAIVVSIASTGIDCNGGTANLTVTASGGTGSLTGTGVFSVTAGTYTYTVTDDNGCTGTATITVTDPTPLVASASAGTILCNGGSADVTVTATGGTGPYTGTATFSQSAGTTTYTVTDANGCTSTTSVTLTEPTVMTAFASCPSILCNGGTTNLAVTAFGGTPPYTGDGVFSVSAGTYTYTLTDANGCTASVTHTVTEPAAIVVSIASTGIDCNGGTADLTVTATGGTAPLTGTGVFNVMAGNYTYTVTDANGCTGTATITVAEPSSLAASATATTIDCNGGTATVTVTAAGGTAPYTGDGTFTVSAGTSTYTVTDANGCSTTVSVTVTEPSALVASATATSILCNGGTADVTVTATGGTGSYIGTGSFTVGGGTYDYTVTDANGCTSTVTITVVEPAAIATTATVGIFDCSSLTADVTITATGGTAPYTLLGISSAPAGTANAPFTSLDQAASVTSAGIYYFDINGVAFDTYVDANGYVQVAIDFGNGTGSLPTGGSLTDNARGCFSASVLSSLVNIEEVRISAGTNDVTTTNAGVIAKLQNNLSLSRGNVDNVINNDWIGSNAIRYTGNATCNKVVSTLNDRVFHPCGNGSGFHWVPLENRQREMWSLGESPDGTKYQLWVKGQVQPNVTSFNQNITVAQGEGTTTYTVVDANGCSVMVSATAQTQSSVSIACPSDQTYDCNDLAYQGQNPGSFVSWNAPTASATSTCNTGCGPNTNTAIAGFNYMGEYNNSRYYVMDSPSYTWQQANIAANNAGGHLATIQSAGENQFIHANMGVSSAWIGFTDQNVEGTFEWINGESVGYTNWDSGEPDNNGPTYGVSNCGEADYAVIRAATAGWADRFECNPNEFIMEVPCNNSSISVTQISGPANGSFVPSGSTDVVTYVATDNATGAADTCSFTLTVIPQQNSVDIVCPGDQTFACTPAEVCGQPTSGATVTWNEPTASSLSTCNTGCGPTTAIAGYIYLGELNGSRYYCSSTSNFSWQAANTAANAAGGHLATIQGAAENQLVQNAIGASEVWIGFTDQNVEGAFEWANGESVGYTNWASTDPDNSGPYNPSGCGEADYTIMKKNSGEWLDRFQCEPHEFVMEVPCGNSITITQTSGPSNGSFQSSGTTEVVTYVATDNNTGATATCSFNVIVDQCPVQYCPSTGTCTAYEWIDQVSLGSINNQSGNDYGYADYTTLATGANVGDVINLTLTPGFSGSSYTEAWRVWIDWNYDGDFYDQGEMVYEGSGTSALNGSFTVPAYATVNTDLRVRISMRWNCYAGPCSTFQYGEVEDYTIFIIDNGGIDGMQTAVGEAGRGSQTNAGAQDNVKSYNDVIEDTQIGGIGVEVGNIYPNPVLTTDGEFNLEVRVGHKSDATVRIIDLSGKVLVTEVMYLETGANKRTMDVTGFARGSYIIQVVSGDLKETTQLIVQ